jgi:CubicO group peptidase (beta-lactamase class C family)
VPGVSLAVINEGRVVSARAYGNTEAGGTNAVTPETLFQAASVSKVAAAAGALLLVQQGKLSLDEDVNTRMKGWKVPENPFTREEKVTVRRILSHTAGFTVHGFPGYARGEALPELTDILDGIGGTKTAPIRVASVPGSQWQYSGGGYTVLQKLMIDVTGQPFAGLMRELLLDPLKMEHSTFEQPLPATLEASAARGNLAKGGEVPGGWNVYPQMAAGGLWTTPSDLGSFFIAIQQALAGRTDGVISPLIAKWMATPVLQGDGLGLFMSGTNNEFFGHDGRNAGFDSLVRCSASSGVVVMINANDNTGVVNRICKAAWIQAGLTPPLPSANRTLDTTVDPRTYQDYVGRYDYGSVINEITIENGRLFTQLTGQNRFELFPSGRDAFFLKVVDAGLIFERDGSGKVVGLIHIQNQNAFRRPRMPAAPVLSAAALDAIAGQYQYGPQAVLTVTRRGNQLYAQLTGQSEYPIFPKSDHEFVWKVVPASVEFTRGADGKVTAAIHHQNGITFTAPKLTAK